jgi:hypothetical protein
MAETQTAERAVESRNTPNLAALIVAGILIVLFAIGAYLIVDLRGRVHSLEVALSRQTGETRVIEDKLHMTNKSMEEAVQRLGSRVGTAQEELARKTSELKAQQERSASRLAAAQQATSKQVQEVDTEVSGVKSELGGARSDIANTRNDLTSTQNDLAATNAKLQSAIGDLNIHSGLIAKNHDELEILKHKGDRNYYEFTLSKKQRRPVSTVSLELKKADPKRSRFTLKVYADDRVYEKKDRTLGEPLQFYTGRDRLLYEIVVFDETKEQIQGYLSTPKQ